MRDVLASGPDFETRVTALEENYMEADEVFALKIAGVLAVTDLPMAYRGFAGSLVGELTTRGAAALYDPQVAWNGENPDAEGTLRTLQEPAPSRLSLPVFWGQLTARRRAWPTASSRPS